MIRSLNTYRNTDVDPELVQEITDAVWKRLLDAFYPVPVWVQHYEHGVWSHGDDLQRMTLHDLSELRWRVLFRHRLDPAANIGYRLEWIDSWIQDALRDEREVEAAAASGICWGRDEPNHDPELDALATHAGQTFEYRRRGVSR